MKFKITRESRSIQQSLPEAEGNDDRRDVSVLMGAVQILVLIGVFTALNLLLAFGPAQQLFGLGLLMVWTLRIASRVSRRFKVILAQLSATFPASPGAIFLLFATTPGAADRIVGGVGGCWFAVVFFFCLSMFYMWKNEKAGISPFGLFWWGNKG